jgi:hypothetical protein
VKLRLQDVCLLLQLVELILTESQAAAAVTAVAVAEATADSSGIASQTPHGKRAVRRRTHEQLFSAVYMTRSDEPIHPTALLVLCAGACGSVRSSRAGCNRQGCQLQQGRAGAAQSASSIRLQADC